MTQRWDDIAWKEERGGKRRGKLNSVPAMNLDDTIIMFKYIYKFPNQH